jgi:hypothetical protein
VPSKAASFTVQINLPHQEIQAVEPLAAIIQPPLSLF